MKRNPENAETMPDSQCPCFADVVRDHGTARFERTLQEAVRGLAGGQLPLCRATMAGGLVDDSNLAVTVMNSNDHGSVIEARIGVFFNEIVGGCNCGDEPISVPAYCLVKVTIDRQTGTAGFRLVDKST